MDQRIFVYRVDVDGCITAVNAAWSFFTRENGADYPADNLLGSVLWNYIGGAETRHVYHMLMERARYSGRVLRFPYRCDSPETRRYMEMEIEYLADSGEFEYRNHLIRLEQRPPVPLVGAPPASGGETDDEDLLSMCSWCKKVSIGTNAWVEVEYAVRLLGLLEAPAMPHISHGICPICRHRFDRGEFS